MLQRPFPFRKQQNYLVSASSSQGSGVVGPVIWSKFPWTPAQISTALWLDAADASTITLNGTTVSQWNDKSGNGRNAVQVTAASQPVYVVGQNRFLYSEQLQQGDWLKEGTTISADAADAPNNTLTADKLNETATSGFHFARKTVTFVANTKYTVSGYFKSAERSIVEIAPLIGGVGSVDVFFNVATGVVTAASAINWTLNSSQISPAGNGWFRCSATFTVGATGGSGFVDYRLVSSGTTITYLGVAGNGAYLWGAQLQIGDLGTYQRTDATAITVEALNSKPALFYDGINDFLYVGGLPTISQPMSVFIVMSDYVGGTADANLYRANAADSAVSYRLGGGANWSIFAGNVLNNSSAYTVAPTMRHDVFNGTSSQIRRDGTAYALGDAGTLGLITSGTFFHLGAGVGAAAPARVKMGEFLIFNRALTTDETQKLEGYAAWKWGLQANLPADHPYKNAAPKV